MARNRVFTQADIDGIVSLIRSWPTASVLLATFGLTLVKDLTFGIVAGCVVAALLAIVRRRVPQEGD